MKMTRAMPAIALLLSGMGGAALAQNTDSSGCDRSQDIPATGYINNPTCGSTYGEDGNNAAPPPPLVVVPAPPPPGQGDSGDSGGEDSGGPQPGGEGFDQPADLGPFLLGDDDFSMIA